MHPQRLRSPLLSYAHRGSADPSIRPGCTQARSFLYPRHPFADDRTGLADSQPATSHRYGVRELTGLSEDSHRFGDADVFGDTVVIEDDHRIIREVSAPRAEVRKCGFLVVVPVDVQQCYGLARVAVRCECGKGPDRGDDLFDIRFRDLRQKVIEERARQLAQHSLAPSRNLRAPRVDSVHTSAVALFGARGEISG